MEHTDQHPLSLRLNLHFVGLFATNLKAGGVRGKESFASVLHGFPLMSQTKIHTVRLSFLFSLSLSLSSLFQFFFDSHLLFENPASGKNCESSGTQSADPESDKPS